MKRSLSLLSVPSVIAALGISAIVSGSVSLTPAQYRGSVNTGGTVYLRAAPAPLDGLHLVKGLVLPSSYDPLGREIREIEGSEENGILAISTRETGRPYAAATTLSSVDPLSFTLSAGTSSRLYSCTAVVKGAAAVDLADSLVLDPDTTAADSIVLSSHTTGFNGWDGSGGYAAEPILHDSPPGIFSAPGLDSVPILLVVMNEDTWAAIDTAYTHAVIENGVTPYVHDCSSVVLNLDSGLNRIYLLVDSGPGIITMLNHYSVLWTDDSAPAAIRTPSGASDSYATVTTTPLSYGRAAGSYLSASAVSDDTLTILLDYADTRPVISYAAANTPYLDTLDTIILRVAAIDSSGRSVHHLAPGADLRVRILYSDSDYGSVEEIMTVWVLDEEEGRFDQSSIISRSAANNYIEAALPHLSLIILGLDTHETVSQPPGGCIIERVLQGRISAFIRPLRDLLFSLRGPSSGLVSLYYAFFQA